MKKHLLLGLIPTMMLSGIANGQIYINENFNAGFPAAWNASVPTCYNSTGDTTAWRLAPNGWRGQGLAGFSLDSTAFVVVDSDLPGTFCQCNEFLTTPVFNATPSATLYLEFDQYFRYYSGGYAETGEVQVYNGSSWVVVATFSSGSGAWLAPSHQSFNITPYINANMQVRFRYNANWDWFWAIDNVTVSESPMTNVQGEQAPAFIGITPNPSSGKFVLGMDRDLGNSWIMVMNCTGEVVLNYKTDEPNRQSVDLSAFPAGIYLIKVSSSEGDRYARLIKEN